MSIRASIQVDEDVTVTNEREHDARCDLARAEALRERIHREAPRTVSWARLALVAALFAIVVGGLILAAGCNSLATQDLAVMREGRALSDGWALEAPSDVAGVAATKKLDSDEDARETAHGTTGYAAWFAAFAAPAPAPTP